MAEHGCVVQILSGAVKGFVMGGIIGGAAGFALSRRPNDIARMAATSGGCFGALKMFVAALIC